MNKLEKQSSNLTVEKMIKVRLLYIIITKMVKSLENQRLMIDKNSSVKVNQEI